MALNFVRPYKQAAGWAKLALTFVAVSVLYDHFVVVGPWTLPDYIAAVVLTVLLRSVMG